MSDWQSRAEKVLLRIHELASISEDEGMITRTYGSDAFIQASKKLKQWMQEAGLETRSDNIGNVRGILHTTAGAKKLVMGSHIDSVVNAGRFDGPLGVLLGLDIIENIKTQKIKLSFNIELIAFCDEEGVRFHTTYLGSKVVADLFDEALLSKKDQQGIILQNVITKMGGHVDMLDQDALSKEEVLSYLEIHIEQGPVLYEADIPVAVVTQIAGQQRILLTFTGVAGHAGTVPMHMRQDALCCAAACIAVIEDIASDKKNGIVATVGKLDIPNAASNVIPGKVICTLDIRSADEKRIDNACTMLKEKLYEICKNRTIIFEWQLIQSAPPVTCDAHSNQLLKNAIKNSGHEVVELVSGAGHDAVPMSAICPVTMLFVRCYKGISHHPLENVALKDIAATIQVVDHFISHLNTNNQQ